MRTLHGVCVTESSQQHHCDHPNQRWICVDWDARWLLRFDGVRFVRWTPPAGEHLPTTAVISLLGAADGSLWIGTASGLAQWKNGNLLNFPETVGRVNSIYEDREGTIWMARSRTQAGAVFKVTLSVAKCGATFHFALPAAPAPPSRLG
jgi:ligand-binding sensor domain-containing protein